MKGLKLTREGTAGAPLIYWLLVVCGLAALTMMRLDNPRETFPVWIGTLSGVGLGQLLAWQRIRGWIPTVVAICGLWFAPVLYFILYDAFGMEAEVATLSFAPAAVCGYLSLTERGALVSFWYPAVLWMLAIIDGSSTTSITVSTGLPLAIGLAVLFIAFLRARESRRVTLWRKYASEKLAEPVAPKVLRTSPIKSFSQLAYTGVVGISALVLAAWIAPHLFKLEQEKERHARELAAAAQNNSWNSYRSYDAAPADLPCCWDDQIVVEEKKVKVKEYLPLSRAQRESETVASISTPQPTACRACGRAGSTYCGMGFSGYSAQPWTWSTTGSDWDPYGYGSGNGAYYGNTYTTGGGYWQNGVWYNNGAYVPPTYVPPVNTYVPPANTYVPPPVNTNLTPPPKRPDPKHPKHPKTPATTTAAPTPPPPPPVVDPTPEVTPKAPEAEPAPVKTVVTPAKAPPRDMTSPWQWTLGICLAGLGLHLLLRALRRTVTLRHLARPFWAETADQRISNHWQRMLIGLGDAGIHPSPNEQPQAFARRVGLEGMTTCATILERVRHGVRLEDSDLDEMNAAASNVYEAARKRAGILGRMTAWIRSPLVEDPEEA